MFELASTKACILDTWEQGFWLLVKSQIGSLSFYLSSENCRCYYFSLVFLEACNEPSLEIASQHDGVY